jgi:glycosyltransferase involved in cell wall biosynthesis
MTKLSVCLTTYNRAALLPKSLDSLLAQTRQPDELIISDDCSQDDTPAVVERYRNKFPNLKYHRNSKNLYMPGNLNAAIQMCTGEYVANLHDADEYAPTLLEDWERSLDRYTSAGFVFCGSVVQRRNGTGFTKHFELYDVDPLTPGRRFYEQHFLHRYSSIVWGTVMGRRNAYDQLLPFNPLYGFVSDVDMWIRMCLAHDVAYVRKPLMRLDASPTSERKFSWPRIDTLRLMQLNNIQRFFADDPNRLNRELWRHKIITQGYYLRRFMGRLRWRDTAAIKEGFKLNQHIWALASR